MMHWQMMHDAFCLDAVVVVICLLVDFKRACASDFKVQKYAASRLCAKPDKVLSKSIVKC